MFFLNHFDDEFYFVQVGFLNRSTGFMSGLQIGLMNTTKELNGFQIGLANFNESGDPFIFMPIINGSLKY